MSILDAFRLDDKVAIVTGASSGLGTDFSRAMTEAGASVVIAARRTDRLQKLERELRERGGKALAVPTDVADPTQCQRLVDAAMEEFSHVDILVNNAGIGTAHPATRETAEQFREVIDLNLNGAYWMAQACGRVMRPKSCIINISSILALTTAGLPQAAYSASKAGLLGLTRDLAYQWGGRKGIRVNAIAPGFFATEMTEGYDEGYLPSQLPRVLLGRVGEAQELSATVIWLASEAGGYVTGQTIVVDGGFTVT